MNKPKGTRDIIGKKRKARDHIFEIFDQIARVYNFERIDTPIFEKQEVFVKSVGETSDIVSKEMFAFEDKKGRKMVLRPEGTAGTMRAIVEGKLYSKLPLKVFYVGPMFRYENPQKGRQRQFTQIGVEYITEEKDWRADIEVIMMGQLLFDALEIPTKIKINSLATKDTRDKYSKALVKHFESHKSELTEDSQNRLTANPLRILDDKVDSKKDFVINAPKISEFYSIEEKEYFDKVTKFLDMQNIEYELDPTLVRGLDYYTDTIFEFVSMSDAAGSQDTILGGGRYSGLIKSFGGPEKTGVGFALGVERLVNEIEHRFDDKPDATDVYVCNIASNEEWPLSVVQLIRMGGFSVEWNSKSTKLNKAFDKADKFSPEIKIICGDNEMDKGEVQMKVGSESKVVKLEELIIEIHDHFMKGMFNEENS